MQQNDWQTRKTEYDWLRLSATAGASLGVTTASQSRRRRPPQTRKLIYKSPTVPERRSFVRHRFRPWLAHGGWGGRVLPAHWGDPLGNDFVTRLTTRTGPSRPARPDWLRPKLGDIQSWERATAVAAAAAAASDRLSAVLSINNNGQPAQRTVQSACTYHVQSPQPTPRQNHFTTLLLMER